MRCTSATRTGTRGTASGQSHTARDRRSRQPTTSDAEREAARLRAEAERAEAERRERRKVVTLNKLGAAATEVRRQFVTTLLARKTLPKGAATFLADCLARDSYMLTQHNRDDVAAELLGIDRAAVPTAVSELPAGSDNRALVIALALVLGSLEARTGKDAWRNPAPVRDPGDRPDLLRVCTGWRYVSEELAAAGVGVHLGDPAEIAALRGPKKRAKTDHADAKLLRTLLLEGRFPESWIPPAHVLEIRTLGRLYCTLMDERRAWQQRIHAQLFHQGCPPIRALLSAAGREALANADLSPTGRQYVDTALRRIDELSRRDRAAANPIGELRPTPTRLPGAAAPLRHRLVVRGDHVGRDR